MLILSIIVLSLAAQGWAGVAISRENGELILWYNSSDTQVATFIFDYCQVVSCPADNWKCHLYKQPIYLCVTDQYYGH